MRTTRATRTKGEGVMIARDGRERARLVFWFRARAMIVGINKWRTNGKTRGGLTRRRVLDDGGELGRVRAIRVDECRLPFVFNRLGIVEGVM